MEEPPQKGKLSLCWHSSTPPGWGKLEEQAEFQPSAAQSNNFLIWPYKGSTNWMHFQLPQLNTLHACRLQVHIPIQVRAAGKLWGGSPIVPRQQQFTEGVWGMATAIWPSSCEALWIYKMEVTPAPCCAAQLPIVRETAVRQRDVLLISSVERELKLLNPLFLQGYHNFERDADRQQGNTASFPKQCSPILDIAASDK